jgi:hypothetical protein
LSNLLCFIELTTSRNQNAVDPQKGWCAGGHWSAERHRARSSNGHPGQGKLWIARHSIVVLGQAWGMK